MSYKGLRVGEIYSGLKPVKAYSDDRDPQELTRNEMVKEIHLLRSNLGMYRDAWLRELGGKVLQKSHLIDALVLTTRWMRERSDKLAVFESEKLNASMESEYGPSARTVAAKREYTKNVEEMPL